MEKKEKKRRKKKRKKYKSILKSFWPITRWALAGNCLSTDSVKPLFLAVISLHVQCNVLMKDQVLTEGYFRAWPHYDFCLEQKIRDSGVTTREARHHRDKWYSVFKGRALTRDKGHSDKSRCPIIPYIQLMLKFLSWNITLPSFILKGSVVSTGRWLYSRTTSGTGKNNGIGKMPVKVVI